VAARRLFLCPKVCAAAGLPFTEIGPMTSSFPDPHNRPDALGEGTTPPVCSAKGCREPAIWALRWNNPRLHSAGRRKTWVACDAHRAQLAEFLDLRGFLRATEPLAGQPGQ
jgi:hypothetical protein